MIKKDMVERVYQSGYEAIARAIRKEARAIGLKVGDSEEFSIEIYKQVTGMMIEDCHE